MLTEKDIELLEYMDYQVMNNGIDGWLGNRAYDKMLDFLELLHKRNSELDQTVAAIFIKVTVSGLGYYQHQHSTFIPEVKKLYDKYKKEIKECNTQYQQVAKDFMNSYGLEDYHTKFMTQFEIERKQDDWQDICIAEKQGLRVPMSDSLIAGFGCDRISWNSWVYTMRDCPQIDLALLLSSHFMSECPEFYGCYAEEQGSAVLYAINSYMKETLIHKQFLQYKEIKGVLERHVTHYLIPVTDNLNLEVRVYSQWIDAFEHEKWVQIDRFVITEDATIADVDKLVTFLCEHHIT